MHGRVFADEALAEAAFVLEKEVAVAVVVEHALSQVEQSAELAQSVAVGLHLPGVVCDSKEDAAAVGGDVAPLVDDVEDAAPHHLERCAKQTKEIFTAWMDSLGPVCSSIWLRVCS